MTYIFQSADFRLWLIFRGYDYYTHRQILKRYRWSQVDILPEALTLWDQQGLLSFQGFMLRGGPRGQYLDHHIFYLLKTLKDQYYIWNMDSMWHKHWPETVYVGQWPIFHGPLSLPYILRII